jgi:predicted nucleic-acid-binding Zn-ribbon protein
MIPFHEVPVGNGAISVSVGKRQLSCHVCGCEQFHERNSLLNTRAATFFNVDWANKDATNYICTDCGYIFWFLGKR